jgi:hypothetical protein
MNTQQFLADFEKEPFSAETKAQVISLIGTATEVSSEMFMSITEILQSELENDLKGVSLEADEVQKLQEELENGLRAIEEEAAVDQGVVAQEIGELDDLSKRIDILEKLHS